MPKRVAWAKEAWMGGTVQEYGPRNPPADARSVSRRCLGRQIAMHTTKGNSAGKKWTASDCQIMREHYRANGARWLADRLGRNISQIYNQACKLGLMQSGGIKHGLASHPLYRILICMKSRCYRANHKSYRYYGGRGIRVCSQWLNSPEAFVAWALDNGWQPGLEIDRINNDGDYCPENCRCVTHAVNSQNTRLRTTGRKLGIDSVGLLKTLSACGWSARQLSARFSISETMVRAIMHGEKWVHVMPSLRIEKVVKGAVE